MLLLKNLNNVIFVFHLFVIKLKIKIIIKNKKRKDGGMLILIVRLTI